MKSYALSSLFFLIAIGLTSCMTREGEVSKTSDTNIAAVIIPDDVIAIEKTTVKHKKISKKAGKVHYFSEFVKKHKSVDNAFAKIIARPNVIVDFYADWCGPCKNLGNFLTSLALQYMHVLIIKVNIEEFPTVAEKFNVRALPTVLFFKDGVIAQRIKGFQVKEFKDSVKRIFG